MAKQNPLLRRNDNKQGYVAKPLIRVLVAFLAGFWSASVVDLEVVSSWIKTTLLPHLMSHQSLERMLIPAPPISTPKPKFEFYTRLTHESKSPANPSMRAAAKPALSLSKQEKKPKLPPQNNTANTIDPPLAGREKKLPFPFAEPMVASSETLGEKESYIVQIASFKSSQEAERMKALLALKGVYVNIVTIDQQQMRWYRVIIGPFVTRSQAEKAQAEIAHREHVMGMVRRMDS